MTSKNNFFYSFFFKCKNGEVGFDKVVFGFVLFLLLLGFAPVLLGSDILGNTERMSQFPVWFFSIIFLGFILGVIYLIKK